MVHLKASWNQREAFQNYLKKVGVNWPVVFDGEWRIARQWHLDGPRMYLLDPNGVILTSFKHIDPPEFESRIEAVVAIAEMGKKGDPILSAAPGTSRPGRPNLETQAGPSPKRPSRLELQALVTGQDASAIISGQIVAPGDTISIELDGRTVSVKCVAIRKGGVDLILDGKEKVTLGMK